MSYPFTSLLHIATAIIAMVTGLLLMLATKGTHRHRQVGYAYVASMVALNLSLLCSLATVVAGAFLVTRHRPKLLMRYGRFQRG